MNRNMMEFEVKLQGTRDGEKLVPDNLDIDEWIQLMENAKNILYPDSKERPHIGVRMEEGSVRLIFTAFAALVIQAHALLGEVRNTNQLDTLKPKQRTALKYFQKFANRNQVSVSLGKSSDLSSGLVLSKESLLSEEHPVWVKTELYIEGKITNIGGKSKSNIHIETEKFGQLVINTTEKILEEDSKNRVYKNQVVRVKINQNPHDLSYDKGSAQLIEFVDHEPSAEENIDEYLNNLIQKSAKDWKDVVDSEAWLKEVRGYE